MGLIKQFLKMSKLNNKDYIYNINLCFIRIESYISGMTESNFDDDPKTRDAVSYCLLNLGKNYSELSTDMKKTYNGFSSIIGMLHKPGCFAEEDLWEVLKNEDIGILQYSDLAQKMFDIELNGKKKTEQKIKTKAPKVEYILDYKYPIRTKSSIWTVKNR